MTKKDLRLLEKVFVAEVRGALPFQSRSKEFKRLEEQGYVIFCKEKMYFKDGLPPMDIDGWCLTHLGRMTYCESCEGEDDD